MLRPHAAAASLDREYEVKGPTFGYTFTLAFNGTLTAAAAKARQFLGSLRNEAGGWVVLAAASPRAGEPPIKAFVGVERTPEQRQKEYQWRCLKRAAAATKDLPWQFENRDILISLNYHPILQLAYGAPSREHAVAWFHSDAAKAAIGNVERKQLVVTFAAMLDQGPSRG